MSAPTAASGPPGGVADIVADLRAGRIDASIAVDRIVTRHIEAAAAAGLDPTMRADLEAHLRRMLADDPTLIAIQEDLARAG
ncbi:MAG: hypothetical protein NZ898_08130 [Myxococcota bacterium]|nr:hypothetical protein [Myxococcota bacterium]MDW8363192.1 hypothetical protein [Myxococcales bacterium]